MTPGTRRDALWLVRSGPGRIELRRRYSKRIWPLSRRLARAYRSTLARRPRVVCVVGSVGKTTTMRAVSAALGVRPHGIALLNANSYASVSSAVLRIRPWQRHAVIEAGIAGPGEMALYAAEIRPDIVVVTAIAGDHWPALGSLEGTRHEKAMMVRALQPSGVAVLNADDPNVRWMATQTSGRVVLVGQAPDADVRATDVELDLPHGTRFMLHAAGRSRQVRIRLIGRHMIFPALAGIAVGLVAGRPLDEVVEAVAAVAPAGGRMVPVVLPGGAILLQDDAKGTLATFLAALDTLAALPARRRTVVFGELRQPPLPEADTYHDLGARVAAVADRAIFVGSKYDAYRAGAISGGLPADGIAAVAGAHEVIAQLRGDLYEGDVVLVKGLWQQRLGRVGLALSGEDVRCRADPCPFKRMACDQCPFLGRPFGGAPRTMARAMASVES